jgi:uncharacterized protein YceK
VETRPGKTRTSKRTGLLAVGFACTALLTGCGGVTDTVSTAVEDSASAIATAQLALGQESAGKLTTAAASTALDDSLKELQASRDSVVKLSPSTQQDRDVRQEALTVLDGCAAGINTARDAVAGSEGAPTPEDSQHALDDAAHRLSDLKTKVGGK